MAKHHACAFTGHRRIEREHLSEIDDLVKRAIRYAYDNGVRSFYAGGALGFDTVCARQVVLFRMSHPDVTLHLLIPCKNQSDKWSDRQREAYEHMLSSADTVEFLYDDYNDECMKERNKRLVEHADMLVAYVGRPYSGAAQTVRFATKAGVEVFNLYPHLNRNK